MQGFTFPYTKFPASEEPDMYRNTNDGQTSRYGFILPFGGHLKEDNRWVQLRKNIDWEIIDEEYQRNFKNKVTGKGISIISCHWFDLYPAPTEPDGPRTG